MKDDASTCPFCHVSADRKIILENSAVYSMLDKSPVSKGHALIIPKQHCANYFDLSVKEQVKCWKMVNEMKEVLSKEFNPEGFNVCININEAAGQTVFHVHIHLIPRYKGQILNFIEKEDISSFAYMKDNLI